MLILSSCSAENELASSGGGNEILFNVEEVPFKPDSTADGAATRATKLTDISSFKLYAYDEGGNAIADGVTYTKSGDSWSPDAKVFWSQIGNVAFYAFSPASNDAVVFDTLTKQLNYTAPTLEGSQQDVLYAYASQERPDNNTVNLTFNHANAAFSVNARLASGCTATVNVSGVSLVNVKPTNTLTFSSGSASASGSNITSALACSGKNLTTSNQAISSSPLIIPPQSVTAWAGNNAISSQTGAYLAVTCKVLSNGTYVVGSSTANGTVYVPMSKALNKGEDNTVNLVFGTLDGSKRYYGRDANGNRISAAEKIMVNGYEAVDLGLSVKWAAYDCTEGNSRNEVGTYYSSYGNISNCANAWGGTWSVPTKAQFQELLNNCTIEWMTNNNVTFFTNHPVYSYTGKTGFKFTSKINGNSIFLPSWGSCSYNGSTFSRSSVGEKGYYWCSDNVVTNGNYHTLYYLKWPNEKNSYNVTNYPYIESMSFTFNYSGKFDTNSYYMVRLVCN